MLTNHTSLLALKLSVHLKEINKLWPSIRFLLGAAENFKIIIKKVATFSKL